MDVTKPYEFIGFGAMEVTKPYEFIGFGAMGETACLPGLVSEPCSLSEAILRPVVPAGTVELGT